MQRALADRSAASPLFVRLPRIIVGIVFDPEPSPWVTAQAEEDAAQ